MTGIGCPNSWQSIDLAGLAMGTVHFECYIIPYYKLSPRKGKERKRSAMTTT